MTRIIVAICLTLSAAASGADAADYPVRPLRLVVGFDEGGPTDIPARFVAEKLGDRLGQRVIVENEHKPGAAGLLATDALSQARDGYNLLLCTHDEAISAAIYKGRAAWALPTGFTVFRLAEFAPISLIAKYSYGVALSSSVPAHDVASFVDYAKGHPGDINYTLVGAGSTQVVLWRQLEKLAGITIMNQTPFPYGPRAVQELVAGRVDVYVGPSPDVIPHDDSGEVRLVAVTSPARLPAAPRVPTLREAGIDYVRYGWLGICAGRGTPQPVIDRLNREIVAVVATEEYRTMIENAGSIAISSSPDELGQVIRETLEDAAATVREFQQGP
jgi:tripartite-type tricarboxylate transporter receptor subunit TctC